MYSQKRRNDKTWIWVVAAIAAVTLLVVILLGYLGRNNDKEVEPANTDNQVYQQQTEEEDKQEVTDAADEEEEDEDHAAAPAEVEQTDSDDEETANATSQAYYLVKYDNHVIRIYFVDQAGKQTELEESTIVYETLAAEDQKRFEEGIKLDSRDDLNKLLMDYES